MRQIVCSGDLNTRMPYPIDKDRPRQLACCTISYRMRRGDDRLVRPAKRFWFAASLRNFMPSVRLDHTLGMD